MSWWTQLFDLGIDRVVKEAGGVVDRFVQTDEDRAKARLELEKVVAARFAQMQQTARTELTARESIIRAELVQGDRFTKRARPSIIYTGLAVVVINYCAAPILAAFADIVLPPLTLPTEFWAAWGGVTGLYVFSRSKEKLGGKDRLTRSVTGTSGHTSLLDNIDND